LKETWHPSVLNGAEQGLSHPLTRWQMAVSTYSGLQLSEPSDIFPAISDIAKMFIGATGWEYFAGMWKEYLIYGLLWRVSIPELCRRCTDWRAPTFSWASIIKQSIEPPENARDGIVYYRHWYFDTSLSVHATAIETNCTMIGGDTTGQLQSAYIILSGILIEKDSALN
jgi:hypothetical protein